MEPYIAAENLERDVETSYETDLSSSYNEMVQ